ncbi:hypothetical protein V5O48_003225 [Marasmius crinis-equi]|uniref:Polymerase nucleotidyl transferase domain-containing protein n=1 Tax=Marasmius crinis-equi TaxID=585013 RepID=A0ABR3FU88_9AGAR
MHYSPTSEEVRTATKALISALKVLGLHCCLVGSVACSSHGTSRTPNDIDMVVLGSVWTQEELKRQVVTTDANFYTVASKDPYATYRVLFYRLPEPEYSYSSSSTLRSSYSSSTRSYYTSYRSRKSCKVDLLLPGIMNIPPVPKYRIYTDKRFQPLMPFLPLLLLKLQAWQDHGESSKDYMRRKQPTDVADITELLNLAVTKYPSVNLEKDALWLPESFVEAAKTRVRRFIRQYSYTKKHWERLGF